MAEEFDAIVIGGGPGGAVTALILARAGWSVGVLEKTRFPRRKVCGEYVSATNVLMLRRLGIAEEFLKLAGPPVREVGLFARETLLRAPLPKAAAAADWGRGLGREVLDTMLLDHAVAAGARAWQPWSATSLNRQKNDFVCKAINKESREVKEFRAPVVIAAHGSWDRGVLPTQAPRGVSRRSDLLAFKAHFRDCALPAGLMPLLVFRGGYGGMVHTDDGRVSLSCCIRRDELERCRRRMGGVPPAEAVRSHIENSCRGVREALAGAKLDDEWISTGPIRPGIRRCFSDGIFCVGNAAGEAHPIIAEGISMAMQSAWVLCDRLIARRREELSSETLQQIGCDYGAAWKRNFAPRVRVAAVFARLALKPAAVEMLLPLFRWFPGALTRGAHWSGKAHEVVLASQQVETGRPVA